jgi:hypothetical protein
MWLVEPAEEKLGYVDGRGWRNIAFELDGSLAFELVSQD